jgi:hypothetical protein
LSFRAQSRNLSLGDCTARPPSQSEILRLRFALRNFAQNDKEWNAFALSSFHRVAADDRKTSLLADAGDSRCNAFEIANVSAPLRAQAPTASLAALPLHKMAQLAFHRFESVVDNFGQRGVRAVIHLLFVGDKFVPRRHRDIDADSKLVSFLMRMIGLLDGDVTSIDVIAEFFEPGRFLQNELVDLFRLLDATIGNVYWPLHS